MHFGAGALGLGLVCPSISVGANIPSYVINRRSLSDKRNELLKRNSAYRIVQSDKREMPVPLEEFLFLPEDSEKVKDLVRSQNTIILTTALKKSGLLESIDFITSIIAERVNAHTGEPMYILACENAVDTLWLKAQIISRLPADLSFRLDSSALHFARCVVDRICNKPTVIDGQVTVVCEPFSRWYIERIGGVTGQLENLLGTPEVAFVDTLDDIIKLKKWVINALHLNIAICAHYHGYTMIDDYLQRDPGGAAHLVGMLDELESMFLNMPEDSRTGFATAEVRHHARTLFDRLMNHPQVVADATTRFKSNQLPTFFEDYGRKVSFLYLESTAETGESFFWVPRSLFYVAEMIAKEDFV